MYTRFYTKYKIPITNIIESAKILIQREYNEELVFKGIYDETNNILYLNDFHDEIEVIRHLNLKIDHKFSKIINIKKFIDENTIVISIEDAKNILSILKDNKNLMSMFRSIYNKLNYQIT